ncbi:MAG: hypothetical protein ACRERV_17020 [Methylococcales bacterium]
MKKYLFIVISLVLATVFTAYETKAESLPYPYRFVIIQTPPLFSEAPFAHA